MIKVIYWGLIALDIAGLLLFFMLGLAAAGSAKTSPLTVAFYLLILPGLVLGASTLLFLRSSSPIGRGLAFALAAAPLIILASTQQFSRAQFRAHSNADGVLTFYKAGPMRDMVEAIRRNDTVAVAALVSRVDVNEPGLANMTLLISALRQLRSTPKQHVVLATLLQAGADPNKSGEYEYPLEVATQVANTTGPEPARLLLTAGAQPNLTNSFGIPMLFTSIGRESGTQVLRLFLDHGADINAMTPKGETALIRAATTPNWAAALLLLERGADWRLGKSFNGSTFLQVVEAHAREQKARADYDGKPVIDDGVAAVTEFLRRHGVRP